MGAEASKDGSGIVTVTRAPLAQHPHQHGSELLHQLDALKQGVPPAPTPQQQAALDLATSAAVAEVCGSASAQLSGVLRDYLAWSGSRRQALGQVQGRLHTRIDEVQSKANTAALHVKRATASMEAAEAALKSLPALVASVTQLVEQTQQVQALLAAAQRQASQMPTRQAAPGPSMRAETKDRQGSSLGREGRWQEDLPQLDRGPSPSPEVMPGATPNVAQDAQQAPT